MTDLATWLGVVVAVVGVVVAYATYKTGRNRIRLEYVIQTRTRIVPRAVADAVDLVHNGTAINDAALTIIRLVNTGDKAIKADDIEAELGFKLTDTSSIASATLTSSRPADLRPALTTTGNTTRFEPRLLNPGDLLVLQILSSGVPSKIEPVGRVTNLRSIVETSLPYPPGSGSEGEMISFDRFMWYVLTPGIILALFIGVPALFGARDWALLAWVAAGAAAVLADLANTARLVRRRRLWRPA